MSCLIKYSLTIRPVALASFRWYGSFTPLVTGPAAIGFSEPLPLPSTVSGLLAGESVSYRPEKGKRILPEDVRELIIERLGLGEDFTLRGPYLYNTKSNSVYLHYWSRTLAEGVERRLVEIRVFENKCVVSLRGVSYCQHTGIALDNIRKSVIEGLIYTQTLTTPELDEVILVEVHRASRKWPTDKIVCKFGGEGRIALIESMDKTPLFELVSKLRLTKRDNRLFTYVATPVILPEECLNDLEKIMRGEKDTIDVKEPPGTKIIIPTLRDLKNVVESEEGKESEKYAKRFRVKLLPLAPGYDMAANILRPLHLAIMPGSIVMVETSLSPQELYIEGVGLYRKLGWGTVVPLPDKIKIV